MASTQAHFNEYDQWVKCVVVGDSGVGKTCLVCSRASDTKYSLPQLVKTKVSTVWAIDHYRTDTEILRRSWCEVDGVTVSLRLWDTFGYHDKDRRFAYSRADVVLLCFSTVRPGSLSHVKKLWIPEIQRFCPNTPIILVGTQVDLRYLYKDEDYVKLNKGLLYREIKEKDVIPPELGREVAREIGADYYETSVLTKHGINDVFDNAIRAALCDRRKVRFWNTELRKLKRPLMQEPLEIPKPKVPVVNVPPGTLSSDLSRLLFHQGDCDAIFVVRDVCFQAHRIVLIVAAEIFHQLFTIDLSDVVISPTSSSSIVQSSKTSATNISDDFSFTDPIDDKQMLIDPDTISLGVRMPSPDQEVPQLKVDDPLPVDAKPLLLQKDLDHPAFQCIQLKQCENPYEPGQVTIQTVISVNPEISPKVFEYILEYLYLGRLREDYDAMDDIQRAAELMELSDVAVMASSLRTNEAYLGVELEKAFQKRRCQKLRELALHKGLLTDITFEVDDGIVSAHKPLLMARCDMMFAMFSNDFIEASAKVVPFAGINRDSFRALQEYLYTEERPAMGGVDCLSLIEVANRLCLQRLLNLTEEYAVQELSRAEEMAEDITEDVIMMLEPAQLMNANQLAKWCLHHLCINFKHLIKKHAKLWKGLKIENQIYIDKNRWPPKWYLKELELYDRSRQESMRRHIKQSFKRQRANSGCLCFGRRSHIKVQRSMSDERP